MSVSTTLVDRRLPLLAVLADCVALVLVFPLAALLVAPELLTGDHARSVQETLPWALLLLNVIVILLDPPEPRVWSVSRAVIAGIWRSTLLFMGLFWLLMISGHAAVVPVNVFVVAWGCSMIATAILRTVRLLFTQHVQI